MIRELLRKDSRDDLIQRFWIWAERHRKRLWVGRYWDDISSKECPESRLCCWQDVMNTTLTDELRWAAGRSVRRNAIWQELPSLKQDVVTDGYERDRQSFIETCEQFACWMHQNHPTWFRHLGSEKQQIDFIRAPEIVFDYARGRNERVYSEPDRWRPALLRFPDTLALGRWVRIILWYMVQRSIGMSKSFENNWDDAHFAHLASYTGAILTKDRQLKRLLAVVFPHVVVVES